LHRKPGGALAPSVGGVGAATEHLLQEYTAALELAARTVTATVEHHADP
jgi:hypothetical protein